MKRGAKNGAKKADGKGFGRVRMSRFPTSIFAAYLFSLLLMCGVHTGLLVLMGRIGLGAVIQSIVPMVYWGLVAVALTLYTRGKIRAVYEKPMHELAEATNRVANGDFSVFVPAIHTSDKRDYLDVIIMDFNKMVEELGSIETLKTDFVSNVSHEMKTPIAVIKNSAQMLRLKSLSEEEKAEYAGTIEAAAGKLSDLITNILKLNKLDNQTIVPDVQTYDVCRQLCECVLQLETKWDEKHIELTMETEEEALVRADGSLLELVWNNLLSNAVKFTEPGGCVTVSQTTEDGRVRVSVSDTGCGMRKESVSHIFEKFYQGDTSHSKEGNGLGLALVKRVLELTDGEISVASRLGEGSTFTVTLPAADTERRRIRDAYGRTGKQAE